MKKLWINCVLPEADIIDNTTVGEIMREGSLEMISLSLLLHGLQWHPHHRRRQRHRALLLVRDPAQYSPLTAVGNSWRQ